MCVSPRSKSSRAQSIQVPPPDRPLIGPWTPTRTSSSVSPFGTLPVVIWTCTRQIERTWFGRRSFVHAHRLADVLVNAPSRATTR
jgi:hypothetical protein